MSNLNNIFKPLGVKSNANQTSKQEGIHTFKRSSTKMVINNPYVKVEKPVYSRVIEVYKGK
ncbi:hypothetical protein [Dubosiella newyorkensis]|uniref:hypothetical protein n=1 Tax=Dubosiella newyorkensis TaxID=1862672 RepID=UPI0023F55859|nr:hypothetical protein [Dubosiella newyorkensis]